MFFGREDIIDQLTALSHKRVASLVTCRGRRRIGKSTLIEEFARRIRARFIKIEGKRPSAKLNDESERATFARQLADQSDAESTTPASWPDAFRRLNAQVSDTETTVILLDEISWIAHYADDFAGDLKIAWDNAFKKHPHLILVVCGSVSSWIRDNIVDNGAFFGRRSLDVIVPELPLSECVKFWGPKARRMDTREITDVLSVTGGVPRYLEEIDPSETAEENIRRLFFSPNAVLRTDFDEMFRDVITEESPFTARVLRQLVEGPLTAVEIAERLGVGKGGRTSSALSRLEESGFVAVCNGLNPETRERPREKRYRLRDNYSRFYLKYVEPVKEVIDAGSFRFAHLRDFINIDTVMGQAFETLVVNNYRELIPHIHLGNQLILSAAPYFRRGTKGKNGRAGVQIDLLLQTRNATCIVEIKRKAKIERDVIPEVDARVSAIRRPAGVSVRTALVYEGELAPGVEADGYFDSVVPFNRLLCIPEP